MGAQANMAKYLAAKASWEAANACIQFHGGFGFACEYDVERKFRETRLYQVAPISTNLIIPMWPSTCWVCHVRFDVRHP
jgi:acyl-CoA dehydrogenase